MLKDRKLRALYYLIIAILGSYFFFAGIIKAKGFLAPLVTALILCLIILPVCKWLEKFMGRTASSLIGTFIILIASVGLFLLVIMQVTNFVDKWPTVKEEMAPKIEKIKEYVVDKTPLTQDELQTFLEQKKSSGSSGEMLNKVGSKFSGGAMYLFSFFGTYLLTFIYIYFLLRYRIMFRKFLTNIFPDDKREKIGTILSESVKVASQYLKGKLILMGLLAVVYSIGLGISGVSNFILVSIIASVLTIIPYIGNIIGFSLALVFGYLTTGDLTTLIGISLTFVVSQFLESYVLQPFVVGDKVDVHPFFIIVVVILGNFLWGIIGMILAIPIMAIITVICLKLNTLKPLGQLFSKTDMED